MCPLPKSTLTGALVVATSLSNFNRSPLRLKIATEFEPLFTAANSSPFNCRTPRALPETPPAPLVDSVCNNSPVDAS
jgi:hypothetical protein